MTGTHTLQQAGPEAQPETTSVNEPESIPDEGTGADSESSPRGTLPLDLVFESLKNSRRRQVLRYLQHNGDGATVGELAEHVASIENDKPIEALSSQQRKRVYVGLYQCHLPKLDDTNVIDYDDDRGTVRLGPNATQLAEYLDVAERADDARPWHAYYLGLAAIGAVLLGAGVAGLGVGSGGTVGTVIAAGVVVGLACLSLVHAATTA